jgi:pyrroline-5-carboxylate reductase
LVLLAIKPQVLTEVAERFVKTEGLLVSILAGISLAKLAQTFPGCRLVRAMPNTPALVSAGITALSIGANEVIDAEVEQLFQAVGQVVKVPESQLDAVTGLSGSGPAYIALITEALIDGGVAAGLPRPLAQELVLATILGSIQMIQTEQLHPAQLKDRVTSPGGTTIAGLAQLENRGVRGALIDAVLAATARARALGN